MMSRAFSISGIFRIMFSFDFINWLSISLYLLNHGDHTCMLHPPHSSLSRTRSSHRHHQRFPEWITSYNKDSLRDFPVGLHSGFKYLLSHLNVDQNNLYNIMFRTLIASMSLINSMCWLLPMKESKSEEPEPLNSILVTLVFFRFFLML